MRLHNSYTNQIEDFKTIDENKVKMYVCGPTVYDNAHLGHARCYITWDVLYRYLKFKGYDVTYCRNVTDVDDKILKKAEKEGKTPEEVRKRPGQDEQKAAGALPRAARQSPFLLPADADQPPDPLRDVHRHENGRQRASGTAGVRHHRLGQSGAGFVAVGQERVDAGLPLRGGLAES